MKRRGFRLLTVGVSQVGVDQVADPWAQMTELAVFRVATRFRLPTRQHVKHPIDAVRLGWAQGTCAGSRLPRCASSALDQLLLSAA